MEGGRHRTAAGIAWPRGAPAAPESEAAEGAAGPIPVRRELPERWSRGKSMSGMGPEAFSHYNFWRTLARCGLIIDKHAAHERQLFEKLAAHYGDVPSQLLLEPLVVELSAEEKTALLANLDLLKAPVSR